MRVAGWLLVLVVALVLVGIGAVARMGGDLENPNDPSIVRPEQPRIMREQLDAAYQALDRRVMLQQITPEERDRRVRELADEFADSIRPEAVSGPEAFGYGEVFRAARRWEQAKAAFEVAVKAASNDDLRVNAYLRLAHCQAVLGDAEGAMKSIRATFDAQAGNKGGILMATLYEVAPAVRGKGKDAALAKLLEEAILQHRQTVVDPQTEAGQAFRMAAPIHIRTAWTEVLELYRAANRPDEVRRAARAAEEMMSGYARV